MMMVADANKGPIVVLFRGGCLRFVGVGQLASGDRQVFLLAVATGSLAVRRIGARCVLRGVDLETCDAALEQGVIATENELIARGNIYLTA